MDLFRYSGGRLLAEGVDVERIAAAGGNARLYLQPRHVRRSSAARCRRRIGSWIRPICFSVKACGNLHILRLMAEPGSGFDIVSGGELYRVLQAGGDPAKVVYAGVGKTDEEILQAHCRPGIGYFNIESEQELENLIRLAERQQAARRPELKAALRVNPDVDYRRPRLSDHGQEGDQVRRGHRAGGVGLRQVRQEPVGPARCASTSISARAARPSIRTSRRSRRSCR